MNRGLKLFPKTLTLVKNFCSYRTFDGVPSSKDCCLGLAERSQAAPSLDELMQIFSQIFIFISPGLSLCTNEWPEHVLKGCDRFQFQCNLFQRKTYRAGS
jgi:hypothetical protein